MYQNTTNVSLWYELSLTRWMSPQMFQTGAALESFFHFLLQKQYEEANDTEGDSVWLNIMLHANWMLFCREDREVCTLLIRDKILLTTMYRVFDPNWALVRPDEELINTYFGSPFLLSGVRIVAPTPAHIYFWICEHCLVWAMYSVAFPWLHRL